MSTWALKSALKLPAPSVETVCTMLACTVSPGPGQMSMVRLTGRLTPEIVPETISVTGSTVPVMVGTLIVVVTVPLLTWTVSPLSMSTRAPWSKNSPLK